MRFLLVAVLFVLSGGGGLNGASDEQPRAADPPTTVLLVRHAERESGQGDDSLSARGRDRAQILAVMLRDAEIRSIITSPLVRTKQTAEPIAQHQNVTPEVVPADKLDALVERIKSTRAGTVLVVHHSNTVPAIVEKLGGAIPPIRDDEFDRLVIMTLAVQGASTVVTLRYGAP